jgi:carboxypeptidase D
MPPMSNRLKMLLLCCLTSSSCITTALRIFPNHHGHEASFESLEQSWKRQLTNNEEPVNVPTAKTPDDHLVTDLPLLDSSKFPTDHWAGLLPSTPEGDNYLFYWLFAPDLTGQPDLQENEIPLIIWLNGGPGCSSMDGLWLETGPFRLTHTPEDDWKIDISEHSWHKAPAYVLFVDQPVGTGLSFTTSENYVTNDDEINTEFYYFLNQFLNLHSIQFLAQGELERQIFRRPLYFAGESYAGHYIPLMMSYIREQNLNATNIDIRLSGAAIGNGWIDPYHQFAIHQAAYGHGIVDQEQVNALDEKERACQGAYVQGEEPPDICYELSDDVIDNSSGDEAPYYVSPYDVRVWDKDGERTEYPDGYQIVESYLGGHSVPHGKPEIGVSYADVLDAIHATPSKDAGQRYIECNGAAGDLPDLDDGVTQEIVELLDAGLNLLFYNGVYDLVCNHVGNEKALDHLEWKHQSEFLLAEGYAWASSDGNIAGYIRAYENLLFLKVLNTGHMVPWDQPLASFDMIKTFLFHNNTGSFKTYNQGIRPREAPETSSCPICPSTSPQDTCPACAECSSDVADISERNDNQANAEQAATSPRGRMKIPDTSKWQAFMVGLLGSVVLVGTSFAVVYVYFAIVNNRSQLPFVNGMESSLGLEMQTTRNGFRDDVSSDEGGDFGLQ